MFSDHNMTGAYKSHCVGWYIGLFGL